MSLIKIAYRQIIDSNSTGDFARNIFNDSFNEFYLQSQAYNPARQWKTFSEIIQHNLKANSLHYKVGFAVGLYIQALKNTIPGLEDLLGRSVSFESFQFEILHSDITDKSAHKVALTYFMPIVELLAMTGNFIVVSKPASEQEMKAVVTLQLRSGLSIVEWQESEMTTAKNFTAQR